KLNGVPGNANGIGARVKLYSGNVVQYQEQQIYKGFQGNVTEVLHFGLADSSVDSVQVEWPSGLSQMIISPQANQRLEVRIEDATVATPTKCAANPRFSLASQHQFVAPSEHFNDFKRQSQLLYSLSQTGPVFAKGDLNGDGEMDLISSTSNEQLWLVDGKKQVPTELDLPGVGTNISTLLCFDADGDGDLDLYVGKGGYGNFTEHDLALQDLVLINDGRENFRPSDLDILPERSTVTSVAVNWDYDGDGEDEIFVGGGYTPGRWPESAGSYLLTRSEGKLDVLEDAVLNTLERVKAAVVYDLDRDGRDELIVASEFDRIRVIGFEDGKLEDRSLEFLPEGKTGLWRSLLIEDLDGDGNPELLAGNWGLNSRLKMEPDIPVRLYFADFDQNGSVDPLMTFAVQGKESPFLSRDELAGQMYRKKATFPTHERFSTAGINEILTAEELSQAELLTAERLETQLFTLKNGK